VAAVVGPQAVTASAEEGRAEVGKVLEPAPAASSGCDAAAVAAGDFVDEVEPATPDQRRTVGGRLIDDNDQSADRGAALRVQTRSRPGVIFESRSSSGSLQIVGRIEQVGGPVRVEFAHDALCGSDLQLTLSSPQRAHVQIDRGSELPVIIEVSAPWAVDATGHNVPTWYEVEGSILRQVVDATDAVAPIVFDPTYSTINCVGHWSDTGAGEYLDMYLGNDFGQCPVNGMFIAANGYWPVWGFETNVANDYGKIILKQDGDCSSPLGFDTGWAWDFQVPCKAHDYCYDLRKAGFSGTVSDGGCDGAFYRLMEAHCNNRVFSGDCRIVRDTYYLAVSAPWVVTDPNPGVVSMYNIETSKCADVEGPSSLDGTPIQQWSCLGVSNQKYRVWPAPGAPGLFQIRPYWISGKCARAAGTWVTQHTCYDSYTSEQFRIQGALNLNMYSIRSKWSNFADCWHVPGNSYANGTNLDDPTCNDYSYWYIWRLYSA
jgi:hypothetical protein